MFYENRIALYIFHFIFIVIVHKIQRNCNASALDTKLKINMHNKIKALWEDMNDFHLTLYNNSMLSSQHNN